MNDTHEAIAPILEFWFGPADADGNLPAREAWFKSDPDFDREVAAQLGPWQPRAAEGGLDSWTDTAEGALALVLLLDQAPRNLYRGDPRTFASDAKAREVADGAIAGGGSTAACNWCSGCSCTCPSSTARCWPTRSARCSCSPNWATTTTSTTPGATMTSSPASADSRIATPC